jgi:hypothetical protein
MVASDLRQKISPVRQLRLLDDLMEVVGSAMTIGMIIMAGIIGAFRRGTCSITETTFYKYIRRVRIATSSHQ